MADFKLLKGYQQYKWKIYADDFETFTNQSSYFKRNNFSNIYLISSKRVDIYKPSNLLPYAPVDFSKTHKIYNYSTKIFINVPDYLEWLRYNEKRQIHYFHNFTKFDFFYLQSFLIYEQKDIIRVNDKQFEKTTRSHEQNKDIWTFKDGGTTFRNIKIALWNEKNNAYTILDFRDSMKLFSGSIEFLSEAFKLDVKKELRFNPHQLQEPFKSYEELKKYPILVNRVKTDSEILSDVLKHYFINPNFLTLGSSIKLTAPALALSHFISDITETYKEEINAGKLRKKEILLNYLEIWDEQKRDKINNFFLIENNYYYGGITSYIPRYKNQILNNISSYDINSMYPSQMVKPLPYGYGIFKKRLTQQDKETKFIFVEMEGTFIQQLNCNFPPVLNKRWCLIKEDGEEFKEHYFYKIDKPFKFCVSKQEADLYLNPKYFKSDIKVIKYVVFNQAPKLKDFILKNYKFKAEATNRVDKESAKLKLNSVYGKFCEKPIRKSYIPKCIYNEDMDLLSIEDSKTPILQKRLKTTYNEEIITFEYSTHTYAPLGCAITSLARSFLISSFISFTEEKGIEIYYTDTDSLKINKQIDNPNLIHPSNLGLWKYEGTKKYFKYIRPKVYIGVSDLNEWTLTKGNEDWMATSGISRKSIREQFKPFQINENTEAKVKQPRRDIRNNPILIDTIKKLNNIN